MHQAGAETIAFGLESSDPTTLKGINKRVQPESLGRAVSQCWEVGMKVELFTLFGLPGDTFDSSLCTLEYVRGNGVKIEGNSVSQHLHLFFGVPVTENRERWKIRCMDITRPAYHSVCRDFTTDKMSQLEIEKMRLLWRLHRTDFKEHVDMGHDLFGVAGFINRNYKKLSDTPAAEILLSRIYHQLDEQQAAARCLARLQQNWPDNPEAQKEIAKPLTGYRGRRRLCVQQGNKIIYGCKGLVKGLVVPETEKFYQMAVIGSGKLLPQFEKGLLGVKSGSGVQFDVTFPKTYGSQALAGRTIGFQVYLHKVMEPGFYNDIEEMKNKPMRNMYRFDDLMGLKKYNEALYYMVLLDVQVKMAVAAT